MSVIKLSPNWQRARTLRDSLLKSIPAGTELWVKIGPPTSEIVKDVLGRVQSPAPRYEVNYTHPEFTGIVIHAAEVELLARSEADFAEDVEMIELEVSPITCGQVSPT